MISLKVAPEGEQAKLSYSDFINSLSSLGSVQNMGLCSDGVNSIYAVHIGVGNQDIVIDGCIHGQHEWTSAYFVRRFMQFLQYPATSPYPEIFRYLFFNYKFHFIPIVNPYGYINGPPVPNDKSLPSTRYNANGVDLNRNFSTMWDNSIDPKGAYPFSEPEAVAIKTLIETYKPLIYMNWHTYGSDGNMTEGSSLNKDIFVLHTRITKEFALATGKSTTIGTNSDTLPMAHLWATNQSSKMGRHIWGTAPEVSYLYSTGEQISYAIAYMILYILNIDTYVKESELP